MPGFMAHLIPMPSDPGMQIQASPSDSHDSEAKVYEYELYEVHPRYLYRVDKLQRCLIP